MKELMTLTSFSLCWTDELFHKVAEDYNNTAFQDMRGERFLWSLVCAICNIPNMTSVPRSQQRKRASTWARRKTLISTLVAITTDAE